MRCPACGQENPDGFRLCGMCGTALAEADSAPRQTRKTVTVVFADVAGSTSLGQQVDPEALRHVMDRYFESARSILERHGGSVEKFIGDAVMSVFGIPVVHEDDAFRAVRAAEELRDELASLEDELAREHGVRIAVRIGLNTGEVVAGDPRSGQSFATGDAVNVAARLESAATPGEVLIGGATYRLVRDAVEVEPVEALSLKGKADVVQAFRLIQVIPGAEPFRRRLDAPMVGRAKELAQLRQAYERAVDERAAYLFTVLGPAGIGKSRLTVEFRESVQDAATVLTGRCLPYGDGITYWPLREMLEQLGSEKTIAQLLEGEEDPRLIVNCVFNALGFSEAVSSNEETFWAVRKLFEALAREQPLVLVFDDLQWAEETMLDLVEHVADWSREAPILQLCVARPDLLELRSSWGGGKLNTTTILLEPLAEGEADALIDGLLQGASLPPSLRGRITEAAEGNPLFVEQMLAMLADNGDAEGEVTVPPTIHALLAARLDHLGGDERAVIERAAVVGKEFWLDAVADLAPSGTEVGSSLQLLVRKDLIRPARSTFPGSDGYRFRHLLIRDTAYGAMPKELRAELHERFVGWLEAQRSGFDEITGYHLEQASRYRADLGRVDERASELAERAAERLGRAGHRAAARGDDRAAANLLDRAVDLVPAGAPKLPELMLELGSALARLMEFGRAEELLTEVAESAAETGNRRLELHAVLERGYVRMLTDPEGRTEELRLLAREAIPIFDQLGDESGLARAWSSLAWVEHLATRWQPRAEAFERALAHARRAGDERQERGMLRALTFSYVFGPMPVDEAIERCEAVLERSPQDRGLKTSYLAALAPLEAMRGRFEVAREYLGRAEAGCEELGNRFGLASCGELGSMAHALANDLEAAERAAGRSYELAEAAGDVGHLSTFAGELGRIVYARGDHAEAQRLSELSEELGASDDIITQMLWRQVRATVLARRGEFERAEQLAREAIEIAAPTDALHHRGDAFVDLAEVLSLAGKPTEAAVALAEAVELYERKGNVVSAEAARARLAELEART